MVPRTLPGTRSARTATAGASIMFRPTMLMQYDSVISPGLVRTPIANSEAPPMMPPARIHGVRRPNRLRVRSDRLPNTRLDTSETIAVIALMEPRRVSGESTPMSRRRCGSRTAATICRPTIQSRPYAKNPAPKRRVRARVNGAPVSGAMSSRVEGAPSGATVACASMRTFFGVMGVGRLHVETSWAGRRRRHHYLPLGRYRRNYDRVVGMSTPSTRPAATQGAGVVAGPRAAGSRGAERPGLRSEPGIGRELDGRPDVEREVAQPADDRAAHVVLGVHVPAARLDHEVDLDVEPAAELGRPDQRLGQVEGGARGVDRRADGRV